MSNLSFWLKLFILYTSSHSLNSPTSWLLENCGSGVQKSIKNENYLYLACENYLYKINTVDFNVPIEEIVLGPAEQKLECSSLGWLQSNRKIKRKFQKFDKSYVYSIDSIPKRKNIFLFLTPRCPKCFLTISCNGDFLRRIKST
jgi:hypothetical protein